MTYLITAVVVVSLALLICGLLDGSRFRNKW